MSKLPNDLEKNLGIEIAADLEKDDWFRLGGETYRVTKTEENDFGQLVIHFTASANKNTDLLSGVPGASKFMVVPKELPFKGYRQKAGNLGRAIVPHLDEHPFSLGYRRPR